VNTDGGDKSSRDAFQLATVAALLWVGSMNDLTKEILAPERPFLEGACAFD
jgi:hypothetical protein